MAPSLAKPLRGKETPEGVDRFRSNCLISPDDSSRNSRSHDFRHTNFRQPRSATDQKDQSSATRAVFFRGYWTRRVDLALLFTHRKEWILDRMRDLAELRKRLAK